MTTTVPASARTLRRRPEAVPRRGGAARWRVAARLAQRQVRRAWASSLLIAVLIALPIAAMAGYTVIGMSAIPSPAEKVAVELGRMQAWVAPAGVAGKGFWQSPVDPGWNGYPQDSSGGNAGPAGAPPADPLSALPAGTETLPIVEGTLRVRTADGVAPVTAWGGTAWDPRFAGRFDLVEGRRPTSDSEAMVTPGSLHRLGISLGERLTIEGAGEFTVVGTLRAASLPADRAAVFLGLSAPAADLLTGTRVWFVPERALSWSDVEKLNEQGVAAFSREVVLDPPDVVRDGMHLTPRPGVFAMIGTVLVIGGVAAAYVVVMLAGAAFAVTARRQQRALAIAASVGAGPRELARTIILQGTTLGAVGGLVGVGAGIGLAGLVMHLTADGSATQYWGFHVPWEAVAAILVFAVAVGTASALVPARTVSRSDTIGALRGARRPQKPTAARPIWGSVILLAGLAITIGCATIAAGVAVAGEEIAWNSPLRTIPPFGIVIGPILVQIGILLSGRWLLWLAARALSRVSLAARIAGRDAAANAGRTVPAFAAIGAVVFIGVFAAGQSAMQTASTARQWMYDAPVGSMSVHVWPGPSSAGELDAEHITAGLDDSRLILADAGAAHVAAVSRQRTDRWRYSEAASAPEGVVFGLAVLPDRYLFDPTTANSYGWTGADPSNNLAVVAPADLETVLGISLSADRMRDYSNGAAVVTDRRYLRSGTVEIAAWSAGDLADGGAPDNIWLPHPDGPERSAPLWSRAVEAISVDARSQSVLIAIAPATADDLGLTTTPDALIASFDEPPGSAVTDRIQADAELASTSEYIVVPYLETGPPSDAVWMIPLLSAVAVLVLGASAVALGLARFERRPDDATLSAVGGTPLLRRRVAFWQGLIIAGFGTAAGAAAGILPPIGFAIQSQTGRALEVADIPWLVLASVAVGLPLAIAVFNALVPPRRPDLTRRTAIA